MWRIQRAIDRCSTITGCRDIRRFTFFRLKFFFRNSQFRKMPKFFLKNKTVNISTSSDRRTTIYSSLDSPHWGASNGGKIMILASIDNEMFQHFQFIRFLKVSRHLSMLESWSYHHSTRLDVANPMSYRLCFYYHWMPRYLWFHKFWSFENFQNSETSFEGQH